MACDIEYSCDICGCRIIENCDGVAYNENDATWDWDLKTNQEQKHICKKCIVGAYNTVNRLTDVKTYPLCG